MDSDLIKRVDLFTSRKITLNQALEYIMLPLYEKNNIIYVAASKENNKGKELIEFLLGKKIEFIYTREKDIKDLINLVLKNNDRLEEDIFRDAVKMKASDIHFEPSNNIVNVRYRINGSLILVRKLMMDEYLKVISRLKVKANMDITERRKSQDGKIIMKIGDNSYNCRISTMPLIGGEKLVLRIIYEEKYEKLDKLNFTKEQKEKIKKIIGVKNGLTIINGPTGSGKTTTLYSILAEIKNENINITTLEDPVEITMEGINQINLNPKAGITFASGLRGILRQDPDVIMIGEIRDEETAKMFVSFF